MVVVADAERPDVTSPANPDLGVQVRQVHRAERLDTTDECLFHALCVCYVASERMPVKLQGQVPRGVVIHVDDEHAHAFVRKAVRACSADGRRSPRDDGHSSLQLHGAPSRCASAYAERLVSALRVARSRGAECQRFEC